MFLTAVTYCNMSHFLISIVRKKYPLIKVKSYVTIEPINHELPIENFEFGQCSQSPDFSSSDESSHYFSKSSKDSRKPQLNITDCGSPKTEAKRVFKEEFRSRGKQREICSKVKKSVKCPKSKSPEKFVFSNYHFKKTVSKKTKRKEFTVSDNTQKISKHEDKSFRSNGFQIYSINDPKWKGILPTPTFSVSKYQKWKGILPTPAPKRSSQTFKKSHHKNSAHAFTPTKPARNTFSKHTNKKVKSDNPRNGKNILFF